MTQRYMHFSAFLPLFLLCREKILCFFLLLLSFRTNLEAYPLLLFCLLDVHLLLFSLQPQIILSRAPSPYSSPLTQKKHGRTVSCCFISRGFRHSCYHSTIYTLSLFSLVDSNVKPFSPSIFTFSILFPNFFAL